jgi:glycosyltransferase involved in cell wall biosynthesis
MAGHFAAMKVMVISPYLPHSRVGHGGGTAVRDLVTWLARDHEVLLAALQRPGERGLEDEVAALSPDGRLQVHPIPFLDNMARGRQRVPLLAKRLSAAGKAASSGYPLYVTKYWSRGLRRRILDLAAEFQPAAVQIEYLQLSLLCRDLRQWRHSRGQNRPRLVLNSHELGSLPRQRRADQASSPLRRRLLRWEAAAWRRLQVDASHWADHTLCVTPGDHELYRAMGGVRLQTVPLGMDLEKISPDWAPADGPNDEGPQFLFVGSFGHGPNVKAAEFLLKKAWPALAEAHPRSRLVMVGRGSDSWLAMHPAGHCPDRVRALGFVDDMTPLFRESHLFLAPLTEGGGIKIKILEAMARGIPVVTSPIGAEGIVEDDDQALYLAPCPGPDGGQEFTAQVLAALADPAAAKARARKARRLMEEKFSWEAITRRLAELYLD